MSNTMMIVLLLVVGLICLLIGVAIGLLITAIYFITTFEITKEDLNNIDKKKISKTESELETKVIGFSIDI